MYPTVSHTPLSPLKKTSAFSLIELMVVIAIVAILGSFALPVVASTSWWCPWQLPGQTAFGGVHCQGSGKPSAGRNYAAQWQTPYGAASRSVLPVRGAHADQLYTIRTKVAGTRTLVGPIKADILNNAANGLPFAANVNLTPPNPAKTKITALAIDPTIDLITITFSPSLTPDNISYTITPLPKQGDYTAASLLQGTSTSSGSVPYRGKPPSRHTSTIPDGSPWWCPGQSQGRPPSVVSL